MDLNFAGQSGWPAKAGWRASRALDKRWYIALGPEVVAQNSGGRHIGAAVMIRVLSQRRVGSPRNSWGQTERRMRKRKGMTAEFHEISARVFVSSGDCPNSNAKLALPAA